MKISSLTETELTYFVNFLKSLANNMKEIEQTSKKLKSLAKKFMPPRNSVNLKIEEVQSVLGLIETSLVSIKEAAAIGIENKEHAEFLEKVVQILSSIKEKINGKS